MLTLTALENIHTRPQKTNKSVTLKILGMTFRALTCPTVWLVAAMLHCAYMAADIVVLTDAVTAELLHSLRC